MGTVHSDEDLSENEEGMGRSSANFHDLSARKIRCNTLNEKSNLSPNKSPEKIKKVNKKVKELL